MAIPVYNPLFVQIKKEADHRVNGSIESFGVPMFFIPERAGQICLYHLFI
jgi:hypothetical protein